MNQNNFEYKKEVKYEDNKTNMMGEYNYTPDSCCTPNYMYGHNMMCPPIHECPQERVCHRYICYEVPHIIPCNTRVINHHVYRHTYTPCYSTCEENVVSNVYDRNCC